MPETSPDPTPIEASREHSESYTGNKQLEHYQNIDAEKRATMVIDMMTKVIEKERAAGNWQNVAAVESDYPEDGFGEPSDGDPPKIFTKKVAGTKDEYVIVMRMFDADNEDDSTVLTALTRVDKKGQPDFKTSGGIIHMMNEAAFNDIVTNRETKLEKGFLRKRSEKHKERNKAAISTALWQGRLSRKAHDAYYKGYMGRSLQESNRAYDKERETESGKEWDKANFGHEEYKAAVLGELTQRYGEVQEEQREEEAEEVQETEDAI